MRYTRHSYYEKRETNPEYVYIAAGIRFILDTSGVEPASILDIGSASGPMLVAMRNLYPAAKLTGLDFGRIPRRRWMLKDDRLADYWALDLNLPEPPDPKRNHPRDLVIFTEVIEHIRPENEEKLVRFAAGVTGSLMVFSGATPGQRGHGHVNPQPTEHWKQVFEGQGLRHHLGHTMTLRRLYRLFRLHIWNNILVFTRPNPV